VTGGRGEAISYSRIQMKSMTPGTDCRDCIFYNGEFCKIPFFSIHKNHPWDYCANFEPRMKDRNTESREIRGGDSSEGREHYSIARQG